MLELEQAAALYLDLVISTDTYTFISLRYFASVSGGTWQWGFVLMHGIKYFEERLIFTQCYVLPHLWPLTHKSTRTEQNMHWKLTIENQLMKAILHNMHVNLIYPISNKHYLWSILTACSCSYFMKACLYLRISPQTLKPMFHYRLADSRKIVPLWLLNFSSISIVFWQSAQ